MSDTMKQYIKPGIVTAAGLLTLTALWFSQPLWREQQRESPHFREGACAVCHAGGTGSDPLKTDEIRLCESCHQPDTHGLVMVPNAEGKEIAVDIGRSHPYGVRPTQGNYPLTLPLRLGYVVCSTCHDVHAENITSSMLRLGTTTNMTPLCHDCHVGY